MITQEAKKKQAVVKFALIVKKQVILNYMPTV